MIASGGCSAAAARAPPPRWSRSRPRIRRPGGSSGAPAGTGARRRRRAPAPSHGDRRGQLHEREREHERRALSFAVSSHMRPPFASAKPRAIARPSPAPGSSGRRRRDGTARRSVHARPPGCRPGSVTRMSTSFRVAVSRTLTGSLGGREAQRVLEHVRERTLDLGSVDTYRRQLVGAVTVTRSAPARSSSACETSSSAVQSSGGASAAPACSRERSRRFSTRRFNRRARPGSSRGARPVAVREAELAALEPVECLLDRRERGSQVVGHGLDHCGLDGVAPSERLRLDRLAREGFALQCHAEEGGERGEEAPLRAERGLLASGV